MVVKSFIALVPEVVDHVLGLALLPVFQGCEQK
jgi:hypothetical protein